MVISDPYLAAEPFGVYSGTTGIDDDFAARGFKNVGAWILGRNMFAPIRGAWPDLSWKGWWGGQSAVPRSGLRFDPSCAAVNPDGRQHHISLCYRRHS